MDVEIAENYPSDCEEEIVEEELIHVVMDDPEEMSTLNPNSNVRMVAIDSDSPALQIENKVCRFICLTNFDDYYFEFRLMSMYVRE
jgi:hypothetical protein